MNKLDIFLDILNTLQKNTFLGIVKLLSFYKKYFLDTIFFYDFSEDKEDELLYLLWKRDNVDEILDYLDKVYSLEREIKFLFTGRFGEKYSEVLDVFIEKYGDIPSWMKRYIHMRNVRKLVSEEKLLGIRQVVEEVKDIIKEELAEYNLNVLIEALYLKEYVGSPKSFKEIYRVVRQNIREKLIEIINSVPNIEKETDPIRTVFSNLYIDRLSFLVAERLSLGFISEPFIFLNTRPSLYSFEKRFTILFGKFDNFFKNVIWEVSNDTRFFNKIEDDNIVIEGVKNDWIDWETLKIYKLIFRRNNFLFESLIKPVTLGKIVIILNMGLNKERFLHKTYSRILEGNNIFLINPYRASIRCDSKFLTHKYVDLFNRISEEKIAMPNFIYIPKFSSSKDIYYEVKRFLDKHFFIVVKPDYGTEGLGIKIFCREDFDKAIKYVVDLTKSQPVIVEEFVGNVYYSDKSRRFSIRVVTAFNGESFVVEGGFAVVANIGSFISSVSHGGYIEDVNKVLSNLYDANGRKLFFKKSDLKTLYNISNKISYAINMGLKKEYMIKYIGLDIVLVHTRNGFRFFLLEANSRPSGLTYLKEINPFKEVRETNIVKGLLKYVSIQYVS